MRVENGAALEPDGGDANTVKYRNLLYCTVLLCIAQYSMYCIAPHTALVSTVLGWVVGYIILYSTVP